MNLEGLRDYVLSLPDSEECFPFGEMDALYKVRVKYLL